MMDCCIMNGCACCNVKEWIEFKKNYGCWYVGRMLADLWRKNESNLCSVLGYCCWELYGENESLMTYVGVVIVSGLICKIMWSYYGFLNL